MRLRKTMTIRKPLVVVSIAAAVAALSACTYTPTADNNYHGTVSGTGAPLSTVAAPAEKICKAPSKRTGCIE